jgi:hypothetical protein
VGGEVRGAQVDHFAGADEQHVLPADGIENAFRQAHRGGGHRHAVRADLGCAAHLLGHRETALEQLVQIGAETAGFVGDAHRILHLAEDLRFAQHHRIEAGSDAERMADGIVLRQHVQVRTQFGKIQLVVVGEEMGGHVERVGRAAGGVHLGAVAGGQQRRLIVAARAEMGIDAPEPGPGGLHGLAELLRPQRQLLAQRDRCCSVVQADGEELHG